MGRGIIIAVSALIVVAVYIWLLYAFFAYLWPRLPIWADVLIVVVLAVSFILSPMMLLLRLK